MMKTNLKNLRATLKKAANPEKAKVLQRFFKTGKGEYAEGDKFLGITVPILRSIAREHHTLELNELDLAISSKIHEERLVSLLILVSKYQQACHEVKQQLFYNFYVNHLPHVNNWDLVDLSAPKITGHYLFNQDRSILLKWANSSNLWIRRIAVMSTFYFIRQKDYFDTLKLAQILLYDREDLIHKAVGWMLREIGKRDFSAAEKFLKQHAQHMPRTMLRYAIEKFPESIRQKYLRQKNSKIDLELR